MNRCFVGSCNLLFVFFWTFYFGLFVESWLRVLFCGQLLKAGTYAEKILRGVFKSKTVIMYYGNIRFENIEQYNICFITKLYLLCILYSQYGCIKIQYIEQ